MKNNKFILGLVYQLLGGIILSVLILLLESSYFERQPIFSLIIGPTLAVALVTYLALKTQSILYVPILITSFAIGLMLLGPTIPDSGGSASGIATLMLIFYLVILYVIVGLFGAIYRWKNKK
ncbi:MAG: hypothetical protein NUV96_02135 [Candidatus Colwellbacteria bacterium]|nr:hypothetical protein [Candidatus Colwellbacteria bacterium]